MAACAKSSTMPGTTPRNTIAPAAMVSATPVPDVDHDARTVGDGRLVVGRRVHREHDAQVDERADDGREHADDGEPVLARRRSRR